MQVLALFNAYDRECTAALPYNSFVDDVVAERVGVAQSRRRTSAPGTMTMKCGEEGAHHQVGTLVTVNDKGRTRHILASNSLGQAAVNQLQEMGRNCAPKRQIPDAHIVKHGRRAGSRGSEEHRQFAA